MRYLIRVGSLMVLALLAVPAIQAGIVLPSPNLLPQGGATYNGPGWVYNSGVVIDFFNVVIGSVSASFLPPQNIGNSASHAFGATVSGTFIVNGGPPSFPAGSANGTYFIQKSGGPGWSSLGTFVTEMLQLDISGLPGGAMIRESPTLASTGTTTLSDAGGGLFRIDSFFDVFTELSLDGGQTWIPSSNGSSHQAIPNVPEPGSVLLLGAGLMCLWRSRKLHVSRKLTDGRFTSRPFPGVEAEASDYEI